MLGNPAASFLPLHVQLLLLKTNSQFAPENRPTGPKRKEKSSSSHPFSGALAVSLQGHYMKPTQTMHYFSGKNPSKITSNIWASSLIHSKYGSHLSPKLTVCLWKMMVGRRFDLVLGPGLFSWGELAVKFQGGIYSPWNPNMEPENRETSEFRHAPRSPNNSPGRKMEKHPDPNHQC